MKNGKRPTRRQRKSMEWAGVNANEWLVFKVDHREGMLHIVHSKINQMKIIPA